jgi:hypothetical protein
MSEHHSRPTDGEHYRIRVRGQLDPTWAEWLDGFEVRWDSPHSSVLTGRVPDQAALHGVLTRLYDLGLHLLAVCCTDPEDRDSSRP